MHRSPPYFTSKDTIRKKSGKLWTWREGGLPDYLHPWSEIGKVQKHITNSAIRKIWITRLGLRDCYVLSLSSLRTAQCHDELCQSDTRREKSCRPTAFASPASAGLFAVGAMSTATGATKTRLIPLNRRVGTVGKDRQTSTMFIGVASGELFFDQSPIVGL